MMTQSILHHFKIFCYPLVECNQNKYKIFRKSCLPSDNHKNIVDVC